MTCGEPTSGEPPRRRRSWRRLWRRTLRRLVLWSVPAGMLLVLAVPWLLERPAAREMLRSRLVHELEQRLATRVELRAADLDLLPLELDLRGLVIHGRFGSVPLARVERLALRVSAFSWLRPGVVFQRVLIEQPLIHLAILGDGSDNLPLLPPSAGGAFDLVIGALELERGELALADVRVPLDLSARSVTASLLDAGAGSVRGDVVAKTVRLDGFGMALPLDLGAAGPALAARVTLSAGQVLVHSARLAAGDLSAFASGRVAWGSAGERVALELRASVPAERLVRAFGGALELAAVRGALEFGGELKVSSRGGASSPTEWRLSGTARAPLLALAGHQLEEVDVPLAADRDGWRLGPASARYAGGVVRSSLWLTADQDGVLEATLEGASGSAVAERWGAALELPAPLAARLDYRFARARVLAGSGQLVVALGGSQPGAGAPDGYGGAPLTEAELVATIDGGRVRANLVRGTVGEHSITGSADLALDRPGATLEWQLRSADLADLERRLAGAGWLVLPALGSEPLSVTGGRGTLEGRFQVATAEPRWALSFEASEVDTSHGRLDRVEGSLELTPTRIEHLRVELRHDHGAALVRGTLGLAAAARPLPAPSADQLSIELSEWPLESLLRAAPASARLPAWVRALSARVAGRGVWQGGVLDAELEAAELASGSVDLGSLNLEGSLSRERLVLRQARLYGPGLELDAHAEAELSGGALRVELQARRVELGQSPVREALPVRGLSGRARASASFTRQAGVERAVGSLAITGLTLDGRPIGDEDTWLELVLAGEALELRGEVPGLVRMRGDGRLASAHEPSPERGSLTLSFELPDLGRLVRASIPEPADALVSLGGTVRDLAGFARGTAVVSARRAESTALGAPALPEFAAEVAITDAAVRIAGRELHQVEPIRLELTAAGVRVRSFYLGEATGAGELIASGKVAEHLDLGVQASVPLAWLDTGSFGVETEGQLELLAVVRGKATQPELSGVAAVRGARAVAEGFPHAFEQLEVVALLYRDAWVLDRVTAQVAGGQLRGQGRVDAPGVVGAEAWPRVDLQAAIEGVSVRYPEDWTLRGGAVLSFAQNKSGERRLAGSVELEEAIYRAPLELGFAQLLRSMFGRTRAQVRETNPIRESVRLQVQVGGERALRVQNNLADLAGTIDLLVQGNLVQPVLLGRVVLERGGTLEYGGDQFVIERGQLTFSNPYQIDPAIDVAAATRRRNYQVTLGLSGTRDRLAATFRSDPPLPEIEVLALLAAGEESSGAAAGLVRQVDTSQSVAANSLLLGQATNLVGQRIVSLFGLDRFRLDPLASGDSLSSARVTLGKRLSRQVMVTYSVDPSSSEGSLIELEWQVSDRVVLVLRQNTDGTYTAEARLERSR